MTILGRLAREGCCLRPLQANSDFYDRRRSGRPRIVMTLTAALSWIPRMSTYTRRKAGGLSGLPQADNLTKPHWDSRAQDALHQAAQDEGLDFPGPGPRP